MKNVIWQTDDGVKTEFEKEYIMEVLLKGMVYEVIYDGGRCEVVDGDTIDADIDLGFDISLTKRIRLAGVDTPESRTADANEKKYGLESKDWLKHRLS